MPPNSRLGRQLQELIASLDRIGAESALIGGLAMAPHNVVRANRDTVRLGEVREYFKLFEREVLLDEILADQP
jgi:hypothetical protein